MSEIWKPIKGYEGKYEISNYGRVKSYAQNKDGKITAGLLNQKGYRVVRLYDQPQHGKWYQVHRLVAMAFIENPNNYEQVNHKDEDKSNNHVDNLEWCTNTYNARYGTKAKRVGLKNRCCATTSERIYSVDKDGRIEYYGSIGEAERQTGLSHCNIVRTLKGRTKHCGGREWYYDNSQNHEQRLSDKDFAA